MEYIDSSGQLVGVAVENTIHNKKSNCDVLYRNNGAMIQATLSKYLHIKLPSK